MLLRSRMTRGVVHTDAPVPHAGLGLDAYVQVTSPIRRYNDLLAHWQLKVRPGTLSLHFLRMSCKQVQVFDPLHVVGSQTHRKAACPVAVGKRPWSYQCMVV